jgi:glycosyltransferase involved in cell wall biosynthesis
MKLAIVLGTRPEFIFPSKNEEKTIAEVIQKAQKAAQQLGLTYEIIVSDNSTDATPQIARSLGAKVVMPSLLMRDE